MVEIKRLPALRIPKMSFDKNTDESRYESACDDANAHNLERSTSSQAVPSMR